MKAVIDTNCLLSCIGKKSPYRNVFNAFLQGTLTIAVNFEILLEYEEIFTKFWGEDGYIRLEKGTNLCGVADDASYPLVD